MDTATPDPIPAEALALAEEQAAKDAELMASLRDKAKRSGVAKRVKTMVTEAEAEQEGFVIDVDGDVSPEEVEQVRRMVADPPMNRAQRRARVKTYAALLAASEKQTPVRNPTIIPRAERRRRKGNRRAH